MRVALCGASGTGKTTLAKWISETYNLPLNPVGSRSTAKAMGFDSPYDVDKAGKRGEFQRKLQSEKIAWERARSAFVTDRTTLDELAYTAMHDVDTVDELYLLEAVGHMRDYTHVFYCPVSAFIRIGDDPHRKSSMTYHALFDAHLHAYLLRWCREWKELNREGSDWRRASIVESLGAP